MELHLPCLVNVGQGNNGYKNIEELLARSCRMKGCHIHLAESERRKPL